MTVSETVLKKAQRLIAQDRVRTVSLDPGRSIVCSVDGDSDCYLVTVVEVDLVPDRSPSSSCSCQRFRHGGGCSHLAAAGLVLLGSRDASAAA